MLGVKTKLFDSITGLRELKVQRDSKPLQALIQFSSFYFYPWELKMLTSLVFEL
jgi:hypothetical protein